MQPTRPRWVAFSRPWRRCGHFFCMVCCYPAPRSGPTISRLRQAAFPIHTGPDATFALGTAGGSRAWARRRMERCYCCRGTGPKGVNGETWREREVEREREGQREKERERALLYVGPTSSSGRHKHVSPGTIASMLASRQERLVTGTCARNILHRVHLHVTVILQDEHLEAFEFSICI